MDTAWIQIFVLTLAECVAPAGKTVCQEREFDLQFLSRDDCEYALEQLLDLKEESSAVIVDRDRSRCTVSARENQVFATLDEVSKASAGNGDWTQPRPDEKEPAQPALSYSDRLESLPDCENYEGRGACKSGGIIVEAANQGQEVEIWRREQ